MVTDRELLQDLRGSPAGQKMLRERELARLAERKDLASEVKKLVAAHEKELPGLTGATDAALAKVREAEAALEAAREDWRTPHVAHMNAAARFNGQLGHLEGQLLETASPAIDAFTAAMIREDERVCRRGLAVDMPRRDGFGEMVGGGSNSRSVNACLKGIRDARVAAEALKLRALTEEELEAELDKLRSAIPEVGPIVEGE